MRDFSYLKVGEKFGTLEIIQEPIIYKHRQMILVQCKCGKQIWIRPTRWKDTMSCKKCVGSTHYPETRKSSAIHYNGLRTVFLRKLSLFSNLNRGENKKLFVELTIQQLYDKLVEQNFRCALSGINLNVLHVDTVASNASIDRIDSSKNYTIDNIQWVHKDINKMKNNFSQERFIEICSLVTNYKYDNPEPSSTNGNL